MTFSPPVVPGVTGLAREDFVFDHTDNPASGTLSYPADDLDPAHVKLSVRQFEADPRSTPAGLEVKFEGPTKISIKRPDGFDAGAIYEFIYTAKDPKVMGLGFAATRDVVSFLRNETADEIVFLEVEENNVPARRLYQRAGFADAGRRERYYRQANGEQLNAVLMRRDLS